VTQSSTEDEADPRTFINLPVVAALNRILLVGIIGFVLVAAFATVPLVFKLDPVIHEAFHVAVPAAWLVFAVVIGLVLTLRPVAHQGDVWARAAEADPDLARFARGAHLGMPVGWLLSMAAVVVNHHLLSPEQAAFTFLVTVPATFALWLLATYAWNAWCRAALARAEHVADERLRTYWRTLGRENPGV